MVLDPELEPLFPESLMRQALLKPGAGLLSAPSSPLQSEGGPNRSTDAAFLAPS